jgi:hypothetical protein
MKCKHGTPSPGFSEYQCAFDEQGKFIKDNWNCPLMNKLRIEHDDNYVSYNVYSEDQHCLVIPFDGKFAIIGFYKSRGKTEAFYILKDSDMREGTASDVAEILLKNKDE